MKITLQIEKTDFPVQNMLDAGVSKEEILEHFVESFLGFYMETPLTKDMHLNIEPIGW